MKNEIVVDGVEYVRKDSVRAEVEDTNVGNGNTGGRNTGDCNTGDWNTGDRNTGLGILGIGILGGQKEEERKLQVEMQDEYPVTNGEEEIKDTPEEWEDRLGEMVDEFDFRESGRKWLDREYTISVKDALIEFIDELLEEREIFTKEEWFLLKLAMNEIHNEGNRVYDEISGKIKKQLDKLNNK